LLIEFILDGQVASRFNLWRHGWLHVNLSATAASAQAQKHELKIRTSRTWQPRPGDAENRDDREISIAVCNIEIKTPPQNYSLTH